MKTKITKKKKQFSPRKGFTLIELLVVIGLISILSAAVITVFNPFGQIQKSQDAKRKSDLSQVQKALELYYQDNGRYPASTASYTITGAAWGSRWGNYTVKLPVDPVSTKRYVYYSTGSNQSYYLYASLDRGANDPQACVTTPPGKDCPSVPGPTLCGGGAICNFGLTSPNVTP